ncbi:NTP transferase domain-containing protein [Gramella sp. KN1008]|uniref:nucleotidyltransferase family protein n=1 Tax=Gramella sp. KN1008 TaxID=2529298 RepID=UPI001038C480|nr:nucleotidyltransferase family protein [Gramella sp. KN1008]TBW27152.1 nucleotidyltransferase family protein [Gramella sp. KN1008]
MTGDSKIGVVILAAGASSRLGSPKQLVEFHGKALLQHMIDIAASMDFYSKVLVLGANLDQVKDGIDSADFAVVNNDDWEKGMASSIRKGLKRSLEIEEELDHLLILLSDQPFVTKEEIRKLISRQLQNDIKATFSQYNEDIGVPAIFSKEAFSDLRNLRGDHGAKKLIYQKEFEFKTVRFQKGDFDVDTKEDVELLKQLENK